MPAKVPNPDKLDVGPRPEGSRFPRWILRADVPDVPLPPMVRYECKRVADLAIDGDVDAKPWPWAEPLVDARTGDPAEHHSRVAMLWDDDNLYAAFDFVDPDRDAIATEAGTHTYDYDTTAELFVGGPGGYHEIGLNSIGIGYELQWYLMEPLVEGADAAGIDRVLRIPDFLYFAPQTGERYGKVGDLGYRMPGLVHAERCHDRPGGPGWSVEMSLPWASLRPVLGIEDLPRPGAEIGVQAMRVHHDPTERAAARAAMERGDGDGSTAVHPWTWSVQGNGNVHNSSRWAVVTLSDEMAG